MQKWNIEETKEYQEGIKQLREADRKVADALKAMQEAQEDVNQELARVRSERIESLTRQREQVQKQIEEEEAEKKACFDRIEASQGSEFTRIFYRNNPAYRSISARQYKVAQMHGLSIGSSKPRFLRMSVEEEQQTMMDYCHKEAMRSGTPVQELAKEYLKLQENLQSLEAELEEIKDGLLEVCETFGHDIEAEKYSRRNYFLVCECCGRHVSAKEYDEMLKRRKIEGVIKAVNLDEYTLTGVVRWDND